MLDQIVQQFMGSDDGRDSVQQLTGQGLTTEQAQQAVVATTESAAAQLDSGGGPGGSGLGGIAGALGGMGGGKGASAGIPPQAIDGIANTVASRTGLSPAMARAAVDAVLPRVIAFVRGRMGVAGTP